MKLPAPCGPVSRRMFGLIRADAFPDPVALPESPLLDDRDVQLALWTAYELFYRGFDDVAESREWDRSVLQLRAQIEARMEGELRLATRGTVEQVSEQGGDVGTAVLRLVQDDGGPRLSSYLRRHATSEQMRDFIRERSVQQLKESDPQSFLLPRLEGSAKVALAEIQYDEYGAGRAGSLHQTLYARALEAVGLDASYGAYVGEVSAISLAGANVMSLFALNRRLRAAGLGHFAAFEASSAVPSRRIAAGLERLRMPPVAAAYFLEHVEADSVHEQVAAREVCGSFVRQHPSSHDDVVFGAASALLLDARSGAELLERWSAADERAS